MITILKTSKLNVIHRFLIVLITLLLFNIIFTQASYASTQYSKDQIKVLDDINAIRSKMGLPAVELDLNLTKAAIDHSIYLFANDTIGHTQEKQLYRTNQFFYERIQQHTGDDFYKSNGWEMIAEDVDYRSPTYAVRDLIEAPYHRYPIIHPELTHIGVGTVGYHNTVLTFGITKARDYTQEPILYPYHNETNVLLSQKVFENPDPFDDTPMKQEEAGYVLSIFTGNKVLSTSLNISLYDEHQNPVSFILKSLTPAEGSDFWIVIPVEKLKPLTNYTFKVNGSESTFKTMSEEEFKKWDIYREDEYVPYESNKTEFDIIIADIKNNLNNNKIGDFNDYLPKPEEVVVEAPKIQLPSSFEQRGYSRDNIGIFLNDDYIQLKPTAKLKNNRTFIPLRGVLESLDALVHYNNVTKEITITQNELKIKLTPNSTTVEITNSNERITEKLDTAPFIENGSTFVPLRFLSQTLGAEVLWDQPSFTVGIVY